MVCLKYRGCVIELFYIDVIGRFFVNYNLRVVREGVESGATGVDAKCYNTVQKCRGNCFVTFTLDRKIAAKFGESCFGSSLAGLPG